MSALFFSFASALGAGTRTPHRPRSPIHAETLRPVVDGSCPLERPDRHLRRSVRRAADLAQGDQSRLPGVLGRFVAGDGVKQGIVGTGRWFDYFGRGRPDLDAGHRDDPGSGVGQAAAGLFDRSVPVSTLLFVVAGRLLHDLGRDRTRPDHPPARPSDSIRLFISGSIWRLVWAWPRVCTSSRRAFCRSSCRCHAVPAGTAHLARRACSTACGSA